MKIFLTRYISRLILLPAFLITSSCVTSENVIQKDSLATQKEAQIKNVLMLMFQESEQGVDPYTTRMLVSSEHLRMDDGEDPGDFTLFDRKQKIIYSVTHENQRILLISNHPTKATWVRELTLEERISEDMQAPEVSGMKPRQVEYLVNGKSCRHIAVVPGLLDQALVALSEFHRVLASEHIRNLDKTPLEMQDPCFLAYEVRHPAKIFRAGFPIHERDHVGRTRTLLDYNYEFPVNPSLFQLPQGYQKFSLSVIQ